MGEVRASEHARSQPAARWLVASLGLASLTLVTGCFPFGVPPMQASVGAAAWRPSPASGTLPAVAVEGRIRPLAFIPTMQARPFDPGIGVVYSIAPHEKRDADWQIGPTFGADAYPAAYVDGDFRARFVVGGELRALYQDLSERRDEWGVGTALRTGIELMEWAEGCGEGSGNRSFAFACGAGEGGGGLYVEGALGYFATGTSYALTLALEFRVPAAVGVVGGI